VTDAAGNPSAGSAVSTSLFTPEPVSPLPTPVPGPSVVGTKQIVVGADAGGSPVVQVANPDGSPRSARAAFDATFSGGVRTAAADFNGDGVADAVVGTGPGGPTLVRVLDGVTGQQLFSVAPFEAAFTGGVFVAAGDLTGDGTPDLVIAPDQGGGPRVLVYDGKSFQLVANFFGIADTNFRGGARPAVGDLNGDGRADLVVAAGFGGGPRIAAFDGRTVVGSGAPSRLFNDIFVFEQTLRNGVFVAAGDVDGDGFADLIVGGGPGGGPRVLALSGKDLSAGRTSDPTTLVNFFAGSPDNRGGVRVAAKDLDGDNKADLVVGDGTGSGSRVTAYYGKDFANGAAPEAFSFDAFPGFDGGVFVG
jgi:hypothetical protein